MASEDEVIEKAWREFSAARREPQPKLVSRRSAFTAGYRAAQAAAPRWIAVGERMPTGLVNIFADGQVRSGWWDEHERNWRDVESAPQDELITYDAEQVTHWMPLPAPPGPPR